MSAARAKRSLPPALHHASNQGLKKEHDKLTERLRKASTLFLPQVQ